MRSTILRLALLGAALALPAYAQTTPDRTAPGTTTRPGVTVPDTSGTTTNPRTESAPAAATATAPAAGANSFTEGQARNRIEAAGFTGVDQLQKDDQGIWRGRAQRNGQQVSVSLDYQGNVTTR